jgi:hypothetical protein
LATTKKCRPVEDVVRKMIALYLDARDGTTIEEAAVVASCLAALAGDGSEGPRRRFGRSHRVETFELKAPNPGERLQATPIFRVSVTLRAAEPANSCGSRG